MDFYFFHQWLHRLKKRRKYLYIVFMTYVVLFTVAICMGIMLFLPFYLGFYVNPWLGLSGLITVPLGALFFLFVLDLFNL